MESQPSLVRPQGRVELHAETAVDLQLALVILPNHAEVDDALWDGGDLKRGLVLWVLLKEAAVLQGGGEFFVGLLELGLGGEVGHGGGIAYGFGMKLFL